MVIASPDPKHPRVPRRERRVVPLRTPDLQSVVAKGANVRRHQYVRELTSIMLYIAATAAILCVVYSSIVLRANIVVWRDLYIACGVIALVPLATGSVLVALRKHEFPITAAVVVTAIVFNFAIVSLSAARVSVSYSALLTCVPLAILGMVYANLKFRRAVGERVGLLDFAAAGSVQEMLGDSVDIIDTSANVVDYDRILIDSDAHHSAQWSKFLTRIYMLGVQITPWISYMEMKLGKSDIDSFDLSHLGFSSSQIFYSKVKRIIDVAAVIVVLPIAVPLGALVWIYIALVNGRPAFFTQVRRGYSGETFTIFKFRTMYKSDGASSTGSNDRRVMPGCRFLRLARIDELPQLINILRGEMSWIGPRPVAVEIAEELEARVPQYVSRQLVMPGLTGWAQVSYGYAGNSSEEIEKLGYDLYYVKHLSFDLDLLIVFKTFQTLLLRSGAR